MKFAEVYPTEQKLSNALQSCESWRDVIASFPVERERISPSPRKENKENEPDEIPAHNERPVRRDRATAANVAVPERTLGQDGKERPSQARAETSRASGKLGTRLGHHPHSGNRWRSAGPPLTPRAPQFR